MINDKGYAIIKKDKENNTLSHAYMLLCKDDNPQEYLLNYAKVLLCGNDGCNNCRVCRLVDKQIFSEMFAQIYEFHSIQLGRLSSFLHLCKTVTIF